MPCAVVVLAVGCFVLYFEHTYFVTFRKVWLLQIYKTDKCHEEATNGRCSKGIFCAFAHDNSMFALLTAACYLHMYAEYFNYYVRNESVLYDIVPVVMCTVHVLVELIIFQYSRHVDVFLVMFSYFD